MAENFFNAQIQNIKPLDKSVQVNSDNLNRAIDTLWKPLLEFFEGNPGAIGEHFNYQENDAKLLQLTNLKRDYEQLLSDSQNGKFNRTV